jgi:hypothetical protein
MRIDKLPHVRVGHLAVVVTEHVGCTTSIGEFVVVRASARSGENVIVHPRASNVALRSY